MTTVRHISFLAALLLCACASTHNLKTDGANVFGGGFIEEELRPGLFKMTARSNMSIWPDFAAARHTWASRADVLCGKDSYSSFDTNTSSGQGAAVPVVVGNALAVSAHNYTATISGYILCHSSSWSVEQARDFLQAEQVRTERELAKGLIEELERLGGAHCAETRPSASAEIYFRRAKLLMALQRYTDARACFISAQAVDQSTPYYQQACESLGLLYEVGLGVEKDMQTARAWYRKAGL